jgi:hypothetical protein
MQELAFWMKVEVVAGFEEWGGGCPDEKDRVQNARGEK